MNDPLLRFRGEFPILERTTYLVSNSLGAMPRAVEARLVEYARTWASEGVRAWAKGWWDMPVSVGDEIAPLIGAASREVAMFPNVTTAQAAVLSALDYTPPRDTIVMTALDFPSVRYVYDALAARLGARVFGERDAPAAAAAVRAALGRGKDQPRGRELQSFGLTPFFAAAALLPLLYVLLRRNLPPDAWRRLLRRARRRETASGRRLEGVS